MEHPHALISRETASVIVSAAQPETKAYQFHDKARSVPDLLALDQAFDALISIISGLGATYKFADVNGTPNLAGSELDEITEMLVDRHIDVMIRLRDARPATDGEAEDRGCALLRWDLRCNQDTTDVALSAVRRAFPGRY